MKEGVIRRSTRPDKKWMVRKNGKTIHAGAKGYTIAPGTIRGDSFCARSSGIPGKTGSMTPNGLARAMWGCVGKKSYASKAKKVGEVYE